MQTPGLVFSTELPLDGPLIVHTLHAEGRGGWLSSPGHSSSRSLDDPLKEENHFPGILLPAEGDMVPSPEPGFHVTPERYEWFRHVLARTIAAGLMAFAGDGRATAPYLTTRQGQRRFTGIAHAATSSVQDAQHTLLGLSFVGTDHVFRLNGTRVEVFSGVEATLFDHVAQERVEQYRNEVYFRRSTWPRDTWDNRWRGPISIHTDGSVLAMRLLPG